VEVAEHSNASRERRGREEALALARTVEKIIVGKGKKVITLDLKSDPLDEDTLAAHLLGPTGNLRAPTFRKGKTLVVGFSEAAYRQLFGTKES
jgi:arsenate reductase-like glutaredoxin family protein